jgi:hypothetical protein
MGAPSVDEQGSISGSPLGIANLKAALGLHLQLGPLYSSCQVISVLLQ